MRIVLQRVSDASVKVDGNIIAFIGKGYLLLVGIAHGDTEEDADWLAKKIAGLRIFNDEDGLMNEDLRQVRGGILSISQFTLHASYKKGNRPSFVDAAKAELAKRLYDYFNEQLSNYSLLPVHAGIFGADMQVTLCNDGPVTLVFDSKNKQ